VNKAGKDKTVQFSNHINTHKRREFQWQILPYKKPITP
jgi:hypothetical protein